MIIEASLIQYPDLMAFLDADGQQKQLILFDVLKEQYELECEFLYYEDNDIFCGTYLKQATKIVKKSFTPVGILIALGKTSHQFFILAAISQADFESRLEQAIEYQQLAVVQLILNYQDVEKNLKNPGQYLIFAEDSATLTYLLNRPKIRDDFAYHDSAVLVFAVRYTPLVARLTKVKLLLDYCPGAINSILTAGRYHGYSSPLEWSISTNQLELVKLFLSYETVVNNLGKMDYAQLDKAVEKYHKDMIHLLLEYPVIFNYINKKRKKFDEFKVNVDAELIGSFIDDKLSLLAQDRVETNLSTITFDTTEQKIAMYITILEYVIKNSTVYTTQHILLLLSPPNIQAYARAHPTTDEAGEVIQLALDLLDNNKTNLDAFQVPDKALKVLESALATNYSLCTVRLPSTIELELKATIDNYLLRNQIIAVFLKGACQSSCLLSRLGDSVLLSIFKQLLINDIELGQTTTIFNSLIAIIGPKQKQQNLIREHQACTAEYLKQKLIIQIDKRLAHHKQHVAIVSELKISLTNNISLTSRQAVQELFLTWCQNYRKAIEHKSVAQHLFHHTQHTSIKGWVMDCAINVLHIDKEQLLIQLAHDTSHPHNLKL